MKAIQKHLQNLQDVGIPLTMVTMCGIAIATIVHMVPEIFEQKAKDRSKFKCSKIFMRIWLHRTMGWSERRVTRAAQKLPDDWTSLCQ